jgi:transcriptional regulator with XRE-family HTH domain
MTVLAQARPVGELLRDWRQRRRMSQLDLACEAEISTKHLSFLETGRSRPSREMVLHLAEQLEVPLRDRNILLGAAGYAPMFHERPLDDPALQAARRGIDLFLAAHDPYPALAVDRHWTMVAGNKGVLNLVQGADPLLLEPPVNVLRLSLHPAGLSSRIANLPQWRTHIIHRLRRQIEVSGDSVLVDLLEEILDYPVLRDPSASASPVLEPSGPGQGGAGQGGAGQGGARLDGSGQNEPEAAQSRPGRSGQEPEFDGVAVPFRLVTIDGILSFYSATTVFGTPVDITLSELAIETFFPADAETARIMREMADGTISRPMVPQPEAG